MLFQGFTEVYYFSGFNKHFIWINAAEVNRRLIHHWGKASLKLNKRNLYKIRTTALLLNGKLRLNQLSPWMRYQKLGYTVKKQLITVGTTAKIEKGKFKE